MANVRWKMAKPQCFSHLPFAISHQAPFFIGRPGYPRAENDRTAGSCATDRIIGAFARGLVIPYRLRGLEPTETVERYRSVHFSFCRKTSK